MTTRTQGGLGRDAFMGDLAVLTRRLLKRILPALAALLVAECCYLWLFNRPGASCFAMIAAGTMILFLVWRAAGRGLPLLLLLAVQTLMAYALPIVVGHPVVKAYSEDHVFTAGWEVLVFCAAAAAAWRAGMQVLAPGRAVCYAFERYSRENSSKLSRLGFILVGSAVSYLVLQSLGLLDFILRMLPSGTGSIIVALLGATSTCGFFLLAMLAGAGDLSLSGRTFLWVAFFIDCFIGASGFLLSAVMITVFSVAIGFFWSTARIPWLFLLGALAGLAFLNVGKYAMRERYWDPEEGAGAIPDFSLTDIPRIYAEWVEVSFEEISSPPSAAPSTFEQPKDDQEQGHSLFDRINNLQNLLYVIDAMDEGHIPALHGATYQLIPALLIPRILWPDKPRSHEGQVLLNIHFGRQDLHATFQTYIAWGLLAEAYGNFGSFWGSLVLGGVLGFVFAWLENLTARKLMMSMEGFVAFAIFLGFANSFEMVASVTVTSIFQAIVPIVVATVPFVRRRVFVVVPGQEPEADPSP